MKRLSIAVFAMAAVALSGCGGGDDSAEASEAETEAADRLAIGQLPTKWHDAIATKNIDLAVSLFAHDGVFTVGGQTLSGADQIRKFLATQSAPFKAENKWISLTHAPRTRSSVAGDRGTIYFDCHYVDPATRQFIASVAGDGKVARIDGRWVFTSLVGGNTILG